MRADLRHPEHTGMGVAAYDAPGHPRPWFAPTVTPFPDPEADVVDDAELRYLHRCIELATEALEEGDEPFGSVLVAPDQTVLAQDRNRVAGGDHTRHPEFALARWAVTNLTPVERAAATVYTSGEHCPMCAAAHGWVGLGRIVFASSSAQLTTWLAEMGVPPPAVRPLPIGEVVPEAVVEGPVPGLAAQVRELQRRYHSPP